MHKINHAKWKAVFLQRQMSKSFIILCAGLMLFFDDGWCKSITVFTQSDTSAPYQTCSKIWTIYYPILCLKIAGLLANSIDPDEMPQYAVIALIAFCICLDTFTWSCPSFWDISSVIIYPAAYSAANNKWVMHFFFCLWFLVFNSE